MFSFIVITSLISSCFVVLFLRNCWLFQKTKRQVSFSERPAVSVLIPARNESEGIRRMLDAVLASKHVELEVSVLDDNSSDTTCQIVESIAATDRRVRLIHGVPLPAGWCGKQFACHQLAQIAQHEELLFLDADVIVTPDAIARCVTQRQNTGVSLISGFPRQLTETLGESLLLPMIHIILLSFLPFDLMRRTRLATASAGCGQLFLTKRTAYLAVGGHAAIRGSLHDGITLPRTYRSAGHHTDVFDASDIAACRMYVGWTNTIEGLLKNAYEGIANPATIFPMTFLMGFAFVVPSSLALQQTLWPTSSMLLAISLAVAALSFVPRIIAAWRFDRSWLSVALFPLAVILFLGLQWFALAKSLAGTRPEWRGRSYAPKAA